MSELPTPIEAGAESGSIILSDLIRMDSLSSSFSFSLLQSVHSFTSEMQFYICWTVVSKWRLKKKKYGGIQLIFVVESGRGHLMFTLDDDIFTQLAAS